MKSRKAYCATEFGDVYYWQMGSGPALLMLHQASQSSEEFAIIAPILAQHYTVIGVDYPGHGRSDDPSDELNVQQFSSTIISVLDALGLQAVHVCGHHSGGLLTIDLAVNHAERVNKAIISGIGVRTEENVEALLSKPLSRDLPIDADGEFLQKTWDVYTRLSSAGVPLEVTFAAFIVALEARRRPYDAHNEMLRWDRTPLLEKIEKRTLLICGELDFFAEDPEQLRDCIAGSEFVSISGAGPFLFHEKPVECAGEIRRFLELGKDQA